jgi:hypothetical protein
MKYLKALGLAVVAAAALAAFLGAASAQATVLCATTSTPCNNRWLKETEIDLQLEIGESFKLKNTVGEVEVECGGSTLKIRTTTNGGATETVLGNATTANIVWSSCSATTTTLAGGEFEFHWISGTDNATVTAKNAKVTFNEVGLSCIYGFGAAMIDVGTFTGGITPRIHLNAVVTKQAGSGFLCPSNEVMTGEYEVDPANMYAEEK